MARSNLSRRDFSQYAFAALGGITAGSLMLGVTGCSNKAGGSGATTGQSTSRPLMPAATEAKMAGTDMHACAGMNDCKGHGGGDMAGKNSCAGKGGCASTAMQHDCKGMNACKGQGGGAMAGENSCKGEGGCAIPMKDQTAWQKARDKFEDKKKSEGKTIGAAPMKS